MSASKLSNLSVSSMVDRYTKIAIDQDHALEYFEIGKYNRLYKQMRAIEEELKSRAGDQRRALLALFSHENVQVRLQAATATLAIEPGTARQLIETIAASQKYPHAGHAGMRLLALDRGIFKPT